MKKVLLIDDNLTALQFIRKIIKNNFNCELKELSESKDSIEFIKEFNPDVLILDVVMPHLDGIEIADNLYKENIQINTFIATSLDKVVNQLILSEYKQKGIIVDYIFKPFTEKDLCLLIKPVLEG